MSRSLKSGLKSLSDYSNSIADVDSLQPDQLQEHKDTGTETMFYTPEHLQRVGLVNLYSTFGTVVALLKMLHDTALTDCGCNTTRYCVDVSISGAHLHHIYIS